MGWRRLVTDQVVRVTDTDTRADIAETLELLNTDAKAMSRRGFTVTRGAEYARQHDRINAVLSDWEQAKA